ncbi:exported hypothetical protein [Acidobacteriia bacterium SbA2]|nr:exported hypothetical protein [Acidobacteriia bacterium SbA2]
MMGCHRLFRPGNLVGVLVLAWAALLAAQTNSNQSGSQKRPESGVLVLKQKVRRVLVDIVVRDSNGKPVHGLTAKDFSVTEDGRSQNVVSFEEYKLDAPSIALPPNAPSQKPNVFVNVPKAAERGPLYVILYDMVNMEVEDQITARQQVLKFIRGKPAGTRFAIYVFSDELRLVQGFTDDRDSLFAALDPHNPKPHVPQSFLLSRNYGYGDAISTMHVLTRIGEFLEGLPGRKNLIWMAGTFPVALYPHEGDPQDLRDDIRRELNELARAQAAVYPVNIRGVVLNPEGALTGLTPYGGSASVEPLPQGSTGGGLATPAANGTTPGGSPDRSTAAMRTGSNLQTSGASGSLASDYMVENDIATATGGKAFHSDNDLNAALTEVTEDGGNYYLLSYAPTNPRYNGSLRKIHVGLDKSAYQLAYRRFYYADDPDAPVSRRAKKEAGDDASEQVAVNAQERPLYASLEYGAPLVHQLIFKVRLHAVGPPAQATPEQLEKLAQQPGFVRGKNKNPAKLPKDLQLQKYAIYYGVVSKQVHLTDKRSIPLEFAAVAFDSEGRVLNGIFEQAAEDESLRPGQPPQPAESREPDVYRAMQELDVPVGATSIRVAVRDLSTDRTGAMEIPLPLPSEPSLSKSVSE